MVDSVDNEDGEGNGDDDVKIQEEDYVEEQSGAEVGMKDKANGSKEAASSSRYLMGHCYGSISGGELKSVCSSKNK